MAKKAEQPDNLVERKMVNVKVNETDEHELFTIVNHEGEYLVALGNQVVSKEKFDSFEAAAHYIDKKPWELILNATAVMWEKLESFKKQQINIK